MDILTVISLSLRHWIVSQCRSQSNDSSLTKDVNKSFS